MNHFIKIKIEDSDTRKKILQPFFVCLLLLLFFNGPVHGNSIDIDHELLKRFSIVEVNGDLVVEVSMEVLLTLALERATTIDILAINEKIAREKLEAAREIYHPILTTSLAKQRDITLSGTNLSGNVKSLTGSTADFLSLTATDTLLLSTTWQKKTAIGISYSVGYQKISSQTKTGSIINEGDTFDGWGAYDDPLFIDNITADINIPILQDWGDVNNIPTYKTQVGVEQTNVQSRKTKLDMLSMIASIYWDLVGVQESIETLKASEKLSEQFVSDTKTRLQLGVIDPIEVKQAESQLLMVRRDLLQENFRKTHIEDQIKVALNLEDLPYGYIPTEKMLIRKHPLDFDTLLKMIYRHNQELKLLNTQLKINGLELTEAQNKDKTDLDLSFTYQTNGYGKNLTSATNNMSKTDLHDYQISLTWNLPLFDKMTPQKIRQVILEKSRVQLNINNTKSLLKVQLQSIMRDLKLAEEGIALTRTSVALVKDLLGKETEKYKLGNSTSFKIAQIQQDLTDAQKNEILARIRYEKIYLSLLILTEKIFDEYHLPN